MLFTWIDRLCRRGAAARRPARRLNPRARLSIEALEERLTPALQLTYGGAGAVLRLMETSPGSDTVAISESVAGTLHFDLGTAIFAPSSSTQGVTYSVPGSPGESSSADVSIADAGAIRKLLIDLGDDNDTLALGMANAANAVGGIQVTHSDSSGLAAITLNSLSLTGDLDVSGGPITVASGATVATHGGDLTLVGVGAAPINGGIGVEIDGATLDSGVNGNLSVTGFGTDIARYLSLPRYSAGEQGFGDNSLTTVVTAGQVFTDNFPPTVAAYGIDVRAGAKVQASGTGSVTFEGHAADGLDSNTGVVLFGAGTAVTTAAGDLSITGFGGNSTGDANDGIDVLSGAAVQTGSGVLRLTGFGGNGVDQNLGVYINGAGTVISTSGGDLLVFGTGFGSGDQNYSVDIEGAAMVRTAGTGTLLLSTPAIPHAVTQTITFNGFHHGSGYLQSGSVVVQLVGDIIDLGDPGSLTSTNHSILVLQPTTLSRPIDLGDQVDQDGALTFTQSDNAAIVQGPGGYGQIIIGRGDGTGLVSTAAALSFKFGVTIESSGAGSQGLRIAHDIDVVGAGIFLNLLGGPVVVSGAATKVSTNGKNLFVFGTGTAGVNGGIGVDIDAATLDSGAGALLVNGSGAAGTSNAYGVYVHNGAKVRTEGSGVLRLNGFGGNGVDQNLGVYINGAGTVISTSGGDLIVFGTGTGSGDQNYSVDIEGAAMVQTAGTGTLLLSTPAIPNAVTQTITFNGFHHGSGYLQSGSGVVQLAGDIIDLGDPGSLTSTNHSLLVLQPTTLSRPIDLGDQVDRDGALTFTQSDNAAIAQGPGGYGQIRIGRGDGTGLVSTAAALSFKCGVTIESSGAGSQGLRIAHDIDVVGAGIFLNLLGGPLVVSGAATKLSTNGNDLFVYGVGTPGVNGGVGVDIDAATLDSGAGGNLTVTGTGAAGTSNPYGVFVHNGANLQAEGGGTVTLKGTSGNGTFTNVGVVLTDASTTVTTADGALSISGNAVGSASSNYGIFMGNHAVVRATGSGTVTLKGTGSSGTGANVGVFLRDASTTVTTADGALSITGNAAGSANSNYGIFMDNHAVVGATGSGTVTLNGTGSSGTGRNVGVFLRDPSTTVTTADGALSIIGIGQGSGSEDFGIYVLAGAKVSASGSGSVTLQGQATGDTPAIKFTSSLDPTGGFLQSAGGGVILTGNVIDLGDPGSITTTGGGTLVFQPYTASRPIDLGNTSDQANALTFTPTDKAALGPQGGASGFSFLVIGRFDGTGTGKVSTFGDLTFKTSVEILSIGANSQGLNISRSIDVGPGHALYLFGGPVVVSGAGKQLLAPGGFLLVHGVGTAGVNGGIGVEINGATLDCGAGALLVTGTGAAGTSNAYGVFVHNGAKVRAEGSGTVTLTGTGGSGSDFNIGVLLTDASTAVTTEGGALSITGNGAGSATSNYGIELIGGAMAQAVGSGTVTLKGTGGNGSDFNIGVRIADAHSAVTTAGGALSITGDGQGGWANNHGIVLAIGAQVQAGGSGTLTLKGTGGSGTNFNIGVRITEATTAVTTAGGALSITGNGHGGGTNNHGILVAASARVMAQGSGTLSLNGTGGSGTDDNIGVWLTDAGTAVTTAGGDLSLTGTGQGSGVGSHGIAVVQAASVSAGGSGSVTLEGRAPGDTPAITFTFPGFGSGFLKSAGGGVTLTGDVIDLGSKGSISTTGGVGKLVFQPYTASWPIDLGNAIDQPGALTFTLTDKDAITQGGATGFSDIFIGRSVDGTGKVSTFADLSFTASVELISPGATSAGLNISNRITVSAGHSLTLAGGPVIVSGVSTMLQTNGGSLNIRGRGTANVNGGVGLEIDAATLDSGPNGSLILVGLGAPGLVRAIGIKIVDGAHVLTGGAGKLTLSGNGGNGTDENFGVFIEGRNTTVATDGGNLEITGTGAGTGSNNFGIGVFSALVQASGSGTLTLKGTGANGTAGTTGNVGILLKTDVTGVNTTVQTLGGNLSLTGIGQGSGTGNDGIDVLAGAVATAGKKGAVMLDGTGTTSAGTGYGVHIFNGGRIVAGNAPSNFGLALNSSSVVTARLSPTNTTGIGYTFIQVDSMVDLGGASLQLAPTGTIIPGMTFNIVVSLNKIKGQFAQGAAITIGGAIYDVNYLGNSVVLIRRP